MKSKGIIIPKGTTKMKVVRGNLAGWHTFTANTKVIVKYINWQTVYYVATGPDKGSYLPSV